VEHAPDFVAVVLGQQGQHVHHEVQVGAFDAKHGQAVVQVGGKRYAIQSVTPLGTILITGTCNGRPFSAQLENGPAKNPLAMRLSHQGTQMDVMVVLPRAAEMMKLMPYKAPPDLSKFLLSPMPGLLADVAVAVGQKVLAGEKLAVIEAMKMENILVAAQDCVVKEIRANKGESLAVDQPIIAFE
jgi:propionyl-CoA carboxylase alpha chain